MPLRTWRICTFPFVGASALGVVRGPRVRCQTNVLGMSRLLAARARPVRNARRFDAALARDLVDRGEASKPFERSAHEIVRIGRTQTLGEDVGHAGALHDGTHRATGDHASARSGRLHEYTTRTVMSHDLVRNRRAGE